MAANITRRRFLGSTGAGLGLAGLRYGAGPAWAADESGQVRPELVWAVLDCPTFFAAYLGEELPISFLVRLGARIDAPVLAGEEHVVIAWPTGVEGRKRWAGSAVLSGDGKVLAAAHALMVEPRD